MGFFENAMYHCSVTKKHFAIRKPAHQKTDDTWHGYQADFNAVTRLKAARYRVTCDEHVVNGITAAPKQLK